MEINFNEVEKCLTEIKEVKDNIREKDKLEFNLSNKLKEWEKIEKAFKDINTFDDLNKNCKKLTYFSKDLLDTVRAPKLEQFIKFISNHNKDSKYFTKNQLNNLKNEIIKIYGELKGNFENVLDECINLEEKIKLTKVRNSVIDIVCNELSQLVENNEYFNKNSLVKYFDETLSFFKNYIIYTYLNHNDTSIDFVEHVKTYLPKELSGENKITKYADLLIDINLSEPLLKVFNKKLIGANYNEVGEQIKKADESFDKIIILLNSKWIIEKPSPNERNILKSWVKLDEQLSNNNDIDENFKAKLDDLNNCIKKLNDIETFEILLNKINEDDQYYKDYNLYVFREDIDKIIDKITSFKSNKIDIQSRMNFKIMLSEIETKYCAINEIKNLWENIFTKIKEEFTFLLDNQKKDYKKAESFEEAIKGEKLQEDLDLMQQIINKYDNSFAISDITNLIEDISTFYETLTECQQKYIDIFKKNLSDSAYNFYKKFEQGNYNIKDIFEYIEAEKINFSTIKELHDNHLITLDITIKE